MLFQTRSGEAVRVGAGRRIRDTNCLIERDLLMLEKRCEGRTIGDLAKLFRLGERQVQRRLNQQVPAEVRAAMERAVRKYMHTGLGVPDAAKDPMRRTLKRHYAALDRERADGDDRGR